MSSTSFRIRRLGPTDVLALRQLNAMFSAAFEDPESYGGAPPSDTYAANLLAKEHIVVLVALSGGDVVGGLVAYELEKFERARSEFYIYDLAVAEAHRRQSIATDLINTLREIAAQRGGWVVYVQADYGDEPAIALYEKLGCREDVMHFDIAVESAAR
ncbi:MAG: AAC(3)-I family aminoglycoside N-acetyltransferase [Rhodospirillaceae bacterium]|nr:AAC(3)-I family aminoglycoside N-acetyltransferase [Rhodospirillaceae bacterium]